MASIWASYHCRGISTGVYGVNKPPKSVQVKFYGVEITSEPLLNMSIEVLYPSPKLLYAQNKFLAAPLQVTTWMANRIGTQADLCPITHHRRRCDATVELSRVGVGGAYWALGLKLVGLVQPSGAVLHSSREPGELSQWL